jgi:hypothetical protein
MQELIQETEELGSLQVCGGNFITPVVDKATYLDEHVYKIGQITYTENAD